MSRQDQTKQQQRSQLMPAQDFQQVRDLVVALKSHEETPPDIRQQVAGLNQAQVKIFQQMMHG